MKKTVFTLCFILVLTLFIAAIPTEEDYAIYEDTLRLHILPSSDSKEDQAIKLEIRDKLLQGCAKGEYGEVTPNMNDDEKQYVVKAVERDVNQWLRDLGSEDLCSVRIEKEWFPTRDYTDFSLPCGYYEALIIDIGAAEGQNWWCVMYPPLCLDIATEDYTPEPVYTEEEEMLIRGYSVKFKVLELINTILK